MTLEAKYVHTNFIAHDWQMLADFYRSVFGCVDLPPERDLKGEWLERATAVAGARIKGVHLKLPGYDDGGPTLEIFSYDPEGEASDKAINRPGLGHIAFSVNDIEAARRAVLAGGGAQIGEVVSLQIAGAGTVTFVYVTDTEGNAIELQSWAP